MKKCLSWNVNGIRAIAKKGFSSWLIGQDPDLMAVQETKAEVSQVPGPIVSPPGYFSWWNSADRKGYSGVAVYAKEKPLNVYYGLDLASKDSEGRVLILEYASFYFMSIYFPNGALNQDRLAYKLRFYDDFLRCYRKIMRTKKTVIVCGDVNTAHTEIDIARPKENEMTSGFLPQERKWLDRFVKEGMVDTFRHVNKEPGWYTWWDYKTRARERNIGWRIDYFYIDRQSQKMLRDAFIYTDVYGSDHCPIGITIDL